MKVVCENCRAVYKVPDEKLRSAVNKATCRNCRFRMLIPRPNAGADPNERILVSAIGPATPSPKEPASQDSPDRTGGNWAPPDAKRPIRRPISDLPRSESLRRGPSPSLPPRMKDVYSSSSPPTPPQKPGPSHPNDTPGIAPSSSRPSGPVNTQNHSSDPSLSPEPPLAPGQLPPPASSSPPTPPTRDSLPISPPPRLGGVEPARPPTPSPTNPQTLRRSTADPRSGPVGSQGLARYSFGGGIRAYDPASDLVWIGVGTTIAAFGSFLLALLAPLATLPLVWVAVVLAVGGAALTIGILWTGARGRRKAQASLVMFVSIPVAVLGATGLVVLKIAGQAVIEHADQSRFIDGSEYDYAPVEQITAQPIDLPTRPTRPEVAPEPDPVVAPAPPTPAQDEETRDEETRDRAQPKAEPPIPAPAPPPPGRSTPPPAATEVAPAPPPLPIRGSDELPETVSPQEIQLMLIDYTKAKACFLPLAQAGALPVQVGTQFKIMPNGTAQDFVVTGPTAHRGGDLETCLRLAVLALQFPESRSGAKVDYPFVLQ